MRIKSPQTGFTLIELMITVSVIAVLASIAIPFLTTFVQRAEIDSNQSEVTQIFLLARSEAVKRGQFTAVVPANSGSGGVGGSVWTTPITAFVDLNSNGVLDQNEPIILTLQSVSGLTLRASAALAQGVGYSPLGAAVSLGPLAVGNGNGNIELVSTKWTGSSNRSTGLICVGVNGRTRLQAEKPYAAEGVPECQ